MPTPYTGNAIAVQPPSPVPSPFALPVVNVPVDGTDIVQVASIYQEFKTLADYISYSQQSLRPGLPQSYGPATNSQQVGYTAVNKTGTAGTGTVTPLSPFSFFGAASEGNFFYSWVFKIITGGAVATATFQMSIDGGATYGATITTAASYIDTVNTSGIFGFVGTFGAGDTYAFSPTLLPRLQYQDGNKNQRAWIDHNGLPSGRYTDTIQDWFAWNTDGGVGAISIASTPTDMDGGRWRISGTASVGTYKAAPAPYGGPDVLGGLTLALTGGGTSGNLTYVRTRGTIASTCGMVAMEFAIGALVNPANATFLIGLFDNYTTMSSSTNRVYLKKAAGDATWKFRAVGTEVATAYAPPAATTYQFFRIEYHSASSPLSIAYGGSTGIAILWLNGVIAQIITGVTAFTGGVGFGIGIEQTSTAAAGQLLISPVRIKCGHAAGAAFID